MAARGPDPHNLRQLARQAAPQAAPVIDVDRRCVGCGYNLRGLRLGINCPECGMPSVLPPDIDDPLSTMPMRVILMLVRGCWVAAICVVLTVIALLAERMGAVDRKIVMPILAGLAVLWWGATFWLTPAFTIPQAIKRGFGPHSRLRMLARWLQLGWVVASVAAAITALLSPAALAAPLAFFQFVGLVIGLAGLVILAILMERLAEWARDEDAQQMFNWAMWGWPIAMILYATVGPVISAWLGSGGHYRIGLVFFMLFWIAAIGTFPYGLLMLSKSVTLSILHNIEYRDREQRRQERDQERIERAGARAARTNPHPMRGKG